jgi:hypothetical protein
LKPDLLSSFDFGGGVDPTKVDVEPDRDRVTGAVSTNASVGSEVGVGIETGAALSSEVDTGTASEH